MVRLSFALAHMSLIFVGMPTLFFIFGVEQARKWATAITHYEAALEILLRLQPGTWEATMLSSVSEDANDLAWIADESSEAVDLLQVMLFSFGYI